MEEKREWICSLLEWYKKGHRDLPWRKTKDPYRIWVSEIMLQQTRVAAVIPYYQRFLSAFPTVYALAKSEEQELLKVWEGLGYYSRARNLRKAAQIVAGELCGIFPETPREWKKLPGVGDYTAGAISAIAFGYPCVAVDGNFLRVWTRLFAVRDAIDFLRVRKRIENEAEQLCKYIPDPGMFANAVMELGAMVCMPKTALCGECPLSQVCEANAKQSWSTYPVRLPKKARRIEKRNICLVYDGRRVVVESRTEKLLSGLFGFPNAKGDADSASMCQALEKMGIFAAYEKKLGEAEHIFTHMTWKMEIYAFRLLEPPSGSWRMADARELTELPMPSAFRCARELALSLLENRL